MSKKEETKKATTKKTTTKKAAPKKKEITHTTRVHVYNNVNNRVVFTDARHNKIIIDRPGEFRVLTVADLQHIMSSARALLIEGILFIKNKDVREYLLIDDLYKNGTIIEYGEIESLLNSKPTEIEKKVKKASEPIKKEVGRKAAEAKNDLTVGSAKTIEKETGVKLNIDE